MSPRRPSGDEGATAVEYGLLVALVVAIAVAAVTLLGSRLTSGYDRTCTPLPSAAAAPAGSTAPVVC